LGNLHRDERGKAGFESEIPVCGMGEKEIRKKIVYATE
jgi:hypothetical protein